MQETTGPSRIDLPKHFQFQFGLPTLFYATSLIASGLALSPKTIWISLGCLYVWWIVFSLPDPKAFVWGHNGNRRWNPIYLLPGGVIILVWVALLIPRAQSSDRYFSSRNTMMQIMIAIENYQSAFGHLPTDRVVILPDGTELRHSWRIPLLPFIGEYELYEQYDFNEPWNGPNNSKIASKMPEFWSYPLSEGRSAESTNYLLVNGPGTAFETGKKINSSTIPDGSMGTVALIEDTVNQLHWMEPAILTAEEATNLQNSKRTRHGPLVVDGLFSRVRRAPSIATLNSPFHGCIFPQQPVEKGVFLINDGVVFTPEPKSDSRTEIKYQAIISLCVYVFLIALPAIILGQKF